MGCEGFRVFGRFWAALFFKGQGKSLLPSVGQTYCKRTIATERFTNLGKLNYSMVVQF